MLNISQKLPNSKKLSKAIIFTIIIVIFLFNINYVLASDVLDIGSWGSGGIGYAVSLILSIIAIIITSVVGLLITVVISILAQVAQYGNIINVPTVINGWVIIRDLCNMSFILILLVIAFATILRQENFSAKKFLPKLLIMAILINFSRTIFGLLIDLSQVIMLTFVNGFSQYGAANFISMFNTNMFLSINTGGEGFTLAGGGNFSATAWSTTMAIIAGVLAAIITLIIVSVMLAVLVARIVMLWIYTIFSPLIFLGFAFPPLQKYTGKLWEDFTKQLVVGPVLAFFIWLAMTTANNSSSILSSQQLTSGNSVCVGVGKFFCTGNFQNFIIVIGLLMGGLMVAQSMGGAAGSIAGKGLDWAKGVAAAPGKLAGYGIGAAVKYKVDKLHKEGKVDLNLVRAWKTLQENRKDKKSRWYAEGQKAGATVMGEKGGRLRGLLAMTAAPGDAWEQISTGFSLRHPLSNKGISQRLKGGKKMAEERERLLPKVEQAEFEDKYSRLESGERVNVISELTKKHSELEADITKETNPEKKAELEKSRDIAFNKLAFADSNRTTSFTDTERENFAEVKEAKQKDYDSNVPAYAFEAKSAEEKAVSLEADKIKRVDDKFELVRMMGEAIHDGEKSRIKAIAKKLTADYNDNEFLEAFVPEHGTGYRGLQALMDGLSTKGDKNYAGFDKQEAYSLGAQIAEMNKRTNHWAAAAAFKMERGEWKKTSAQEHTQIATGEFGKRAPRANAREFNRLAMGIHKLDKKIGKIQYKLEPEGLVALQSWDNPTSIDRMLEDMTESTAKFLVPFLKKLEDETFFKARGPKFVSGVKDSKGNEIVDDKYRPTLPDMIRMKANEAKEDFTKQFNDVSGMAEKVNS